MRSDWQISKNRNALPQHNKKKIANNNKTKIVSIVLQLGEWTIQNEYVFVWMIMVLRTSAGISPHRFWSCLQACIQQVFAPSMGREENMVYRGAKVVDALLSKLQHKRAVISMFKSSSLVFIGKTVFEFYDDMCLCIRFNRTQ